MFGRQLARLVTIRCANADCRVGLAASDRDWLSRGAPDKPLLDPVHKLPVPPSVAALELSEHVRQLSNPLLGLEQERVFVCLRLEIGLVVRVDLPLEEVDPALVIVVGLMKPLDGVLERLNLLLQLLVLLSFNFFISRCMSGTH